MKHPELIAQMTLEEKAALCSGKDYWHLNGCEKLALKSITVSDGPHGLRKKEEKKDGSGGSDTVEAVCFPTASATACSWDEDLIFKMGQALGDECRAEKVAVLLGPGVNIKRSPLCGRNFEYFSEDPYLAGKMAAAFIKGVQSKGIGVSLKHFAANDQETRRMMIDTVADERTLREIYLPAFETAVREAAPRTVMNAYNKLNGRYCAENEWLLTKVLREDWGFDGIVMTDWCAENDIVEGIAAGQNLEMPGSNGAGAAKIVKAVRDGILPEEKLDERADELIDLIMYAMDTYGEYSYSKEEHHLLAREVAENSMVLLKNEDGMLPLDKSKKIAVIGEMAKKPRYQGSGSSKVNTSNVENAFDAFSDAGVDAVYAAGYDINSDATVLGLLREAVETAKNADAAVIFAGLTDDYESEGYDRTHMRMPQSHLDLIRAVSAANKNTVVVLSGGAPVEMPWADKVRGILDAFLGGEAGASAAVRILLGEVNPSGKLAETVPFRLEDTPAYNYFPGNKKSVEYRESVYVGYRYYDKKDVPVRFPFGFGLSYTSFEYSGIKLSKKSVKDTDKITVSFKVKNVGDTAGAEIAQVYVRDVESTVFRPERELKGFKKVFLAPGEEKTVETELDKRAFAYYNVPLGGWHVESGDFEIAVGASSRDIRLTSTVKVKSTDENAPLPDLRETAPSYYTGDIKLVGDDEFEALLGREIPYKAAPAGGKITPDSPMEDAASTTAGRIIRSVLTEGFSASSGGNKEQASRMADMAMQVPIRCFVSMSMGVFTPDMAQALCDILNGDGALKGLGRILSGLTQTAKDVGWLVKSL